MSQPERAEIVFDVMRTRRAVRSFTERPVAVSDIRRIIAAARWASSAGNRRLQRFFVTRDRAKIDLISAVGPGFYGKPPAVIVICADLAKSRAAGVKDDGEELKVDVGMAAMNMQLMAHALGLGTTPVTSVSFSGLRAALELPDYLRPELILQLGHPAPGGAPGFGSGQRIRPEDITDWEVVSGAIPDDG
ncbi:MAG TPA: nitroreductase family protein [Thermomicrobiales bacterium]|nr:nitroreductase family protein [Thermomicrobiales bacterium]